MDKRSCSATSAAALLLAFATDTRSHAMSPDAELREHVGLRLGKWLMPENAFDTYLDLGHIDCFSKTKKAEFSFIRMTRRLAELFLIIFRRKSNDSTEASFGAV